MRINKKIYVLMVLLVSLFVTGAGVEGEYAYYAGSEEQAREIAERLGAQLLSFCHGIAAVRMEKTEMGNGAELRQKIWPDEEVYLYPELLYTVDSPVDYDEAGQWHLDMVNAPGAWEMTMGGGIKVAVIDTGVDGGHEDLGEAVISSVTMIPQEYYGNDGTFPEEYEGAQDNLGHGTHVAGIIGARRNGYGSTGIAPECGIISIKALEKNADGTGKGKSSWVAAAVMEAIEAGADIINMSIGGSRIEDRLLYDAIAKAHEKGIVVVCAAGNAASSKIYYPAGYEETIAVSAVRRLGSTVTFASSYSNYGDWVDLCAPGSSIFSTVPGGYGEKTGTSMACPVVSGAAALLLSVDKSLTPEQTADIMKASAIDLGERGFDDKYGYGMVDIRSMLDNYDRGGRLAMPEPDVPSGRTVCEGALIRLATDTRGARIVYTLDNTPPDADSMAYPGEGMSFTADDSPVTIRAVSVSSRDGMSGEAILRYYVIKPVQELLASRGEYAGETLPQYGIYRDPVSGISCRRYKIMVKAGHRLEVAVNGVDFTPEVNIYDGEDASGISVAEGNGDALVKWENIAGYDQNVWISVMAPGCTDKSHDPTYSIKWVTYPMAQETESTERQEREDTGGHESGDNRETKPCTVYQEPASEPSTGSLEAPPLQSDMEEKDMLYTMKTDTAEYAESHEAMIAGKPYGENVTHASQDAQEEKSEKSEKNESENMPGIEDIRVCETDSVSEVEAKTETGTGARPENTYAAKISGNLETPGTTALKIMLAVAICLTFAKCKKKK